MNDAGFTLFETGIGICAIRWRAGKIAGTTVPERSADALRARWATKYPEFTEQAPPPFVAEAIVAIRGLLVTGRGDLSHTPLDMSAVGAFEARVYAEALAIPPGETRTYGDLARALGDVALSRAVGQALGANPFPPIVPCHRILAASGKTGGFSAPGGVDTKMRMLTIERARTSEDPMLFDTLDFARRTGS